MSTHPNAILAVALTPKDGHGVIEDGQTLLRQILDESDKPYSGEDVIKINGEDYNAMVMHDAYDEAFQIYAKTGQVVVFDMVTYGYGETITWAKLETFKTALESWALSMSGKFGCTYEIFVTANYW